MCSQRPTKYEKIHYANVYDQNGQLAASASSLWLTACCLPPAACNLPLASCNANRKDATESLQMELQMREPRCECICLSARSVSPPPPSTTVTPLPTLRLSLCPLALQFRALLQAASHQLNIVMRFTPTPHTPPPPPHTLSLTRCQYTIRISVGISPLVKFVVQVT